MRAIVQGFMVNTFNTFYAIPSIMNTIITLGFFCHLSIKVFFLSSLFNIRVQEAKN